MMGRRNFMIRDEDWEAIDQTAREMGLTASALLRQATLEFVRRRQAERLAPLVGTRRSRRPERWSASRDEERARAPA
jgi:hypothetical protein